MGFRRWGMGLVLWALGVCLGAQLPERGAPLITNYDQDQHGAHIQSWVGVQDRRGVLYFGNTEGILEFDGQRWRRIVPEGSPVVRSLAVGPEGMIYYGSIGDFGHLASTPGGGLQAVSLRNAVPEPERGFNDVWQVVPTSEGICFLTRRHIFRFQGGRLTVLPGSMAASQACALNGTLFFADQDRGLCMVVGQRILPLPQAAGLYNGKRITLTPFGPHELLLGRLTGDWKRLDLGTLWDPVARRYDPDRPLARVQIQSFPTPLEGLLDENQGNLYRMEPYGSSEFLASSLRAGVFRFDRQGHILSTVTRDMGLMDNSVNGLLVDRDLNLWATTDQGISQVAWTVPQTFLGERNGLQGVPLRIHVHRGRLLVGTYQALYAQLRTSGSQPQFRALRNSPREIWQFQEVEGDLLAVTGSGLVKVDEAASHRIPVLGDPTCLSMTTSRRWPGHLFVGIMGGVDVYRKAGGQWRPLGRMKGVQGNIQRILEDEEGNLWMSSDVQGIFRTRFRDGLPMEVDVHNLGPEVGLPGRIGLRIHLQGRSLFVVSPQGLFRAEVQPWPPGGPDPTHFTPDPHLGRVLAARGGALLDMTPYGEGGFILNTRTGFLWAQPDDQGGFRLEERPFQGIASMDEQIFIHSDQSVWIPGRQLIRVEPRADKAYDSPFDVLIRRVATPQRALFEGTWDQGNPTPQVLTHREHALAFQFAATFFERPTQFQVLLEGLEGDWSPWTSVAFKEYTNLRPGTYRFRVRARNAYGTLGREASFPFRIRAPWYATLWARGLWGLAVGGVLLGFLRGSTLLLRRQKQVLARQVALRTQEVQDQAQRILESNQELERANFRLQEMDGLKKKLAAMLVHDLRSPLTSISLALDLYEVKRTLNEEQLGFMRHSLTHMITLLNDLLEIFRGEVTEMPLVLAEVPVPALLRAVHARFLDQATQAGITLEFDVPEDLPALQAEANKVDRAISNLMGNALKYTQQGDTVSLSARVLQGVGVEEGLRFVTIQVKDSGQGIPPEELPFIFDPYRQVAHKGANLGVGLGLAIVHRIMAAHQGRVTVRSQVGVGTAFMLFFPLPGKP